MSVVQNKIKLQLQTNSEINNVTEKQVSVEHIKDWIRKQPHLPDVEDDVFLMSFLRGCKYSPEKAKKKLDMYFTMRGVAPEFFNNRDPLLSDFKDFFKVANVLTMPRLTQEGYRIVIFHTKNMDEMIWDPAFSMKLLFMLADIRLNEERNNETGDIYIFDGGSLKSNFLSTQLPRYTPSLLKKCATCSIEAYPFIIKGVHVINISPVVETTTNFLKIFLKEKIKRRIHLHSSYKSLYNYIPKEFLPEEYGGQQGTMAEINKYWYGKLVSYREWFLEQENIKTDESRRPEKPKTYGDFFGMDGSFKKLSVD
ncbi:alpha-tocopherol transfer protein-like isoform X2 [Daktulosphaira vitifoliae]|nr:alpha-tocopherol transfer protein-like isoform X2 [Daktulosphaira vitifoliae]